MKKNVKFKIGNTPLSEFFRYCRAKALYARILGKLESFNPAGSVKDRVAEAMISDAEKRGVLKSGSVIIEPTSGNTGIGLAACAALRGYRLILTMPDTMSVERRALLKAYGAEVVLTDGALGMTGSIEKAKSLSQEIADGVILDQFQNSANPAAHFKTTGPEIFKQSKGEIDILVAGVGTGGTITGAGRFLKSKNSKIKIVAVEPAESPVLSGGKSGAHKIQGIGAGFVPPLFDKSVVDEIITVSFEDAVETLKELRRTEDYFAGLSSGAALAAATLIARRPENTGKTIVVILPDGGERYLSVL